MEAMNRSLIVCVLALSPSAFATEGQFDDLRTNFKQYDRQQVTVNGILEVAGNDNYVYRDIQGSQHEVEIEIDAPPWATSFDVERGEVGSADIYKGRNNVTVKTKDGKVLTKLKFDNARSSGFYDRRRHAYYFRIMDRKITPVPRTEARNWKFAPTPERD